MAFYPQFPALYAYPMPLPNQEFYALYPPGGHPGGPPPASVPPGSGMEGAVFYDNGLLTPALTPGGHLGGRSHPPSAHKHGYNNRKDSSDSGISGYSSSSSRKSSNTSVISNASGVLETSALDDVEEEVPYETPDDDLCEKIVQQVEFYFSDANISKDKFLLKHVKRNKEGFVSLKLISSFKRVKHLTKDWRQVAEAIERASVKLEVNDLKTKVRRRDALPDYDETTPSRTVVALNLPLERPTIEGVAEIFAPCGDIVLIRVLRPGNPIPADIKPFVNKHPEMGAQVCALVEFECTESALRAVRELNDTRGLFKSGSEEEPEAKKDDEVAEVAEVAEKMKVMELTAPPTKNAKKDEKKKLSKSGPQTPHLGPQRRFSHAGMSHAMAPHAHPAHALAHAHAQAHAHAHAHVAHHGASEGAGLAPRRRISLLHNMKFSPMSEAQQKKEYALNPNAPTFQMQQRRLSHGPFVHPATAMEAAAAAAAAAASHKVQMQYAAAASAAATAHPWVSRRVSMKEMATSGLALPVNVMRMPRGPDKGKGFQRWCRHRMEASTSPTLTGQGQGALAKKPSHAVPIVAPPSPDHKEAPALEKAPETEPAKVVKKDPLEEKAREGSSSTPEAAAKAPIPIAAALSESSEDPEEPELPEAPEPLQDPVESCSDSGNEEGTFSEHEQEHELDLALLENERTR